MHNKVDMKKVQARLAEHKHQDAERKSRANFLELKEGDTKIRILPPWSSDNMWCKQAKYHYNVKEKSALACLKFHLNQPCPACEVADSLFATKDPNDKELAFTIRAKPRFFANVMDLTVNDGKVYLFGFGVSIEKDIVLLMVGPDDQASGDTFGYGDITDPVSGRNLLINKVVPADKRQTKYKVQCSQQPTPVSNWSTVKDSMYDLDAYVAQDIITYDAMKAILENRAEPVAQTTTPLVAPDTDEVNPAEVFESPAARPAAQDTFVAPPAAVKGEPATTQPSAPQTQQIGSGLSSTLAKLRGQRTNSPSK